MNNQDSHCRCGTDGEQVSIDHFCNADLAGR